VLVAPIGSMIRSFKTPGSGRFHTFNSASAVRFTRTSLYSQKVPGAASVRVRPARRSATSGLSQSVPSHSLVCVSR
jgi:hypothetical protein